MARVGKAAKARARRKGAAILLTAALILGGAIFGLTRLPHREPEPQVQLQETEPTLLTNRLSPSDFQVVDGQVTCTAGNVLQGIDVSSHQQQIDWAQVKEAGIAFAMIRVGYRGYVHGIIREDSFGRENYRQAGEAGLKRGVYFYSQAITPEEAREEAEFVLEFLGDAQPELPVVFDWEYVSDKARTGAVSRQQMTDCALAFCQTIGAAGLKPMVYFNQDLVNTRLDLTAVQGYDFWLAQYADALTYPVAVSMWQYTDAGEVPGIQGKVDRNLLFLAEEPQNSKGF